MQGMVGVLRERGDQHSLFVREQIRDDFRVELRQEFGGVGVRIGLVGQPPMPVILGPPEPGTPAFLADIRSGDILLAVDGTETPGLPIDQIVKLTRGQPGTEVVLSILHEGDLTPEDIPLTRSIINVESVCGDLRDPDGAWRYLLDRNPRIAYIRIISFGDKTEEELAQVLELSTAAGAEAFILDVRDNYGGALDAAVGISDLFLRGGLPIVTTRGRDQRTRGQAVSTGNGHYTTPPLAVLINHNSASASEIVAACLQDHDRAVVVGERTFGKGTVQSLMELEAGRSLLKLTSATYWRPSGKNINRMPGDTEEDEWGVSPNPGFEVLLDNQQYLTWRKYRRLRDIFGTETSSPVAQELDPQSGPLPEGYSDEALDTAAVYLAEALNR